MRILFSILVISTLATGCGGDSNSADVTGTDADTTDANTTDANTTDTGGDANAACTPITPAQYPTSCLGTEPDGGCAIGAVVDEAGCGLEGIKVLACDDDSCITGSTDSSGIYNIFVPAGWRKMQLLASKLGFMNMLFHSDVEAGPTPSSRNIIVVPNPSTMVDLPTEEGGTAVVADGALEITAQPGNAEYPIGSEEQIVATAVAAANLPPYDTEPWTGKEDGTLAFHVNPVPVKYCPAQADPESTECGEGAGFSYKVTGAAAGTTYDVYYVDDHEGRLKAAGVADSDMDGNVSGDGIMTLTTLILIPQ